MTIPPFQAAPADTASRADLRQSCSKFLRTAMEVIVLLMVCLSPWAFGSAGADFEFVLYAGIALLLGLWALQILVEGELSWKKCPVALVLGGLVLYGAWQLTPLPERVLPVLSPATARMYEQLLPSQAELLPSGEKLEPSFLRAGSTLSLY